MKSLNRYLTESLVALTAASFAAGAKKSSLGSLETVSKQNYCRIGDVFNKQMAYYAGEEWPGYITVANTYGDSLSYMDLSKDEDANKILGRLLYSSLIHKPSGFFSSPDVDKYVIKHQDCYIIPFYAEELPDLKGKSNNIGVICPLKDKNIQWEGKDPKSFLIVKDGYVAYRGELGETEPIALTEIGGPHNKVSLKKFKW